MPHQESWLVDPATLQRQIGISLRERVKLFHKEFPKAKINATLLRQIYRRHKIKKKAYQWFKVDKKRSQLEMNRDLARVKRQLTLARKD